MYDVESSSTLIKGFKLKSKGIVNFEELYTEMVNWFRHYGYNWKELEYKKVDLPEGAQQIELRWECPKEIDNYVSMITTIFIQAMISDVEVEIGGEKKRMNKGTVEVQFTTKMLKNVEMWEGKPFGKIAGLIYDKILIKERLDAYEGEIINETQKLISEVKEYLQIYAR